MSTSEDHSNALSERELKLERDINDLKLKNKLLSIILEHKELKYDERKQRLATKEEQLKKDEELLGDIRWRLIQRKQKLVLKEKEIQEKTHLRPTETVEVEDPMSQRMAALENAVNLNTNKFRVRSSVASIVRTSNEEPSRAKKVLPPTGFNPAMTSSMRTIRYPPGMDVLDITRDLIRRTDEVLNRKPLNNLIHTYTGSDSPRQSNLIQDKMTSVSLPLSAFVNTIHDERRSTRDRISPSTSRDRKRATPTSSGTVCPSPAEAFVKKTTEKPNNIYAAQLVLARKYSTSVGSDNVHLTLKNELSEELSANPEETNTETLNSTVEPSSRPNIDWAIVPYHRPGSPTSAPLPKQKAEGMAIVPYRPIQVTLRQSPATPAIAFPTIDVLRTPMTAIMPYRQPKCSPVSIQSICGRSPETPKKGLWNHFRVTPHNNTLPLKFKSLLLILFVAVLQVYQRFGHSLEAETQEVQIRLTRNHLKCCRSRRPGCDFWPPNLSVRKSRVGPTWKVLSSWRNGSWSPIRPTPDLMCAYSIGKLVRTSRRRRVSPSKLLGLHNTSRKKRLKYCSKEHNWFANPARYKSNRRKRRIWRIAWPDRKEAVVKQRHTGLSALDYRWTPPPRAPSSNFIYFT